MDIEDKKNEVHEDLSKQTWNKKVAYYHDDSIGCYNYSSGHPMKPLRVAMTDELVKSYKLDHHMNRFDRDYVEANMLEVSEKIFTNFHSDEYIDLIKVLHPNNKHHHEDQLYRFNFGDDCPVMERLYEYCLTYTSGSVAGAQLLKDKKVEHAVNWSGGLHHAKQSEASGFCYINDCVLAILELLKVYQRVLYIDIDIHHGDGVEEAFYLTDRVMTASFHKFKDYFPGTGHLNDVGKNKGLNYSVNFPLSEGMDDESYEKIFQPVMDSIFKNFRPEAVVLQCGADSLSGDRLGCFNLSVKGHGKCVTYVKKFGVPILLLGGGGYTLRNIPRCWSYETSLICEQEVENDLPEHEFYHYYGPEYKLHLPISNMENTNTTNQLNETSNMICQNLEKILAPSAHITNYNDIKSNIPNISASDIISAVEDKHLDAQK